MPINVSMIWFNQYDCLMRKIVCPHPRLPHKMQMQSWINTFAMSRINVWSNTSQHRHGMETFSALLWAASRIGGCAFSSA